MRTCDFCGRRAEQADTLTWVTSEERGRELLYCDACARANLRAIEGKLDQEWW